MDEDLFSLEGEEVWENRADSKEELLNQEFALGDDDLLVDAAEELFDTEESLW